MPKLPVAPSHPTKDDLSSAGVGFVATAIRHGMLEQHHAEKILAYVDETGVSASDAALTLSLLEAHEVDAVELLENPAGLVPGMELRGILGTGATGMVFRACQTALQRDVALKTMITSSASSNTQARLQREARAIASLQHPHIVAVYDSGYHRGRYCIAMEMVQGETLADLIRQRNRLSEDVTWRIARQVASALAHAADSSLIHRDIKPSNILLTRPPVGTSLPSDTPFAKVVDFGLAFPAGSQSDQLTATGATLGTPAYVAPEQLQDTHVDTRADIFSLGATVFHMLAGHAPLSDRSPMRAIMHKTIGNDGWRDQFPGDVTDATVKLFRDMTEADPNQRIGNYVDLIQRMDQVLSGMNAKEPSRVPVESRAERSADSVRQRHGMRMRPLRWIVPSSLAVGALIFTLALSGTVWRRSSSPQQTWQVSGLARPLFNGVTVPVNLQEAGIWLPTSASDGSRVLAGRRGARLLIPMTFPASESRNVRFRVGVYFAEPGELVVSAGSADDWHPDAALLRLTTGELEMLDGAEPSNAGGTRSLEIEAPDPQQVVFQRLMVARQGDQLLIKFNGTVLATAPAHSDAPTVLRLECKQGSVNLADLDVAELTPVAATRDNLRL